MNNNFSYKVRYEYEVSHKAYPSLTHGVWGGISPQNEIEMNFYVESNKVPAAVEQLVSKDGSLEQKSVMGDEEIHTITRHIHSRIVMNRDAARSILEWLQRKIEILDLEEDNSSLSFHNKIKLEQ